MNDRPASVNAIIPAAGRSRRLGRDKQLINIQGRPLLCRVLEALLQTGVHRVCIVTRQTIAKALLLNPQDRIRVVFNEDDSSEMIDSIRMGLDELIRLDASPEGGFLVCPGDLPDLSVSDVGLCVEAFTLTPDRIIMASHRGRRGHPMIVPASLVPAIRSTVCDEGLHRLPAAFPEHVRLVEVGSEGVLRDLDHPGDVP